MAEWYISVGGVRQGPYPTAEVQRLIAEGSIPPEAHVWRDGMVEWQPLSQTEFGIPPLRPPLPPPMPYPAMQLSPPPPQSMYPCRGCGRPIHVTAAACPHCGAVNEHHPDYSPTDKRILIAFVLCFFLGGLGMHRFYVGKWGTAILMIVTLAGLGIWWLVDMIIIATGNFTDRDGNKITVWL
ncbi:MAG: NINE protein [Ancalomicrobiaceae bacterium]|nr:NINE protein [Ancalomicrobiaceae bacterium]